MGAKSIRIGERSFPLTSHVMEQTGSGPHRWYRCFC
jgi:hypothetical protein